MFCIILYFLKHFLIDLNSKQEIEGQGKVQHILKLIVEAARQLARMPAAFVTARCGFSRWSPHRLCW